jgi:large conductance mechanosensitive channel
VFLMVKAINRLRRQQAAEPEAGPAAPTATEALLAEIRDELRTRPRS